MLELFIKPNLTYVLIQLFRAIYLSIFDTSKESLYISSNLLKKYINILKSQLMFTKLDKHRYSWCKLLHRVYPVKIGTIAGASGFPRGEPIKMSVIADANHGQNFGLGMEWSGMYLHMLAERIHIRCLNVECKWLNF